jgi:hypothetical protein
MPLTNRDRRTLTVGGIVVAVLLVGFLLFNLLSGGGPEQALPSFPAPHPPTTSTGPTGPTTTPAPVAVFTGRDPFSKPAAFLVTSSPGSSSGSSSTSGPPSSSSSGPPPTQPGGGSAQSIGGHQVVLLDTFTVNGQERAQVEIDGTVYNVSIGESFGPGGRFELRSVSGDCATFLFGDESFTLCITPRK